MRGLVVCLCVISLVGVAVLGAPIRASPGPTPGDRLPGEAGADGPPARVNDPGVAATQPDPGQIAMSFHVRENGTAVATVAYWIPLNDQSSTRTFERFKRDLRQNRSKYVGRFERRMRGTVANAERTTGREMSIGNVTMRVYRGPQEYGVVEYSFRWHGFAAVNDDRIVVGPSLGGLHLSDTTRLLISWPTEYEAETVASTVADRRENSAVWSGPTTFGRNGPRVVLDREGGLYSQVTEGMAPIAGMAFLLVAGVVALRWWRTGSGSGRPDGPFGVLSGFGTVADTGDAADAESAGAAAAASGSSSGDEGATDDEAPPPELMSNHESVLRELEQRGGRAKQKEVVESLGWSDAKGSRVISDLREDDEVETFRLGNENVLTLPDEQGLIPDTDRETDANDGGDDDA